jgi:hypothetical protein
VTVPLFAQSWLDRHLDPAAATRAALDALRTLDHQRERGRTRPAAPETRAVAATAVPGQAVLRRPPRETRPARPPAQQALLEIERHQIAATPLVSNDSNASRSFAVVRLIRECTSEYDNAADAAPAGSHA